MPAGKTTSPMQDPHSALMNRVYRFQRHIYDISRKYYLLGRDELIRSLDARPGMSVLEIGCGTGRNLIAAARRWPEAHFTGLDISSAMLEKAGSSVKRHKLDRRITLVEGDACGFASQATLNGRRYDRIFLSYAISMIPAWEYAIEEAISALTQDGSLHIVDFGQQEQLPGAWRSLLFAWLNHFHVRPRGDLAAVLEDAARRHGRSLSFRRLYKGYAYYAQIR